MPNIFNSRIPAPPLKRKYTVHHMTNDEDVRYTLQHANIYKLIYCTFVGCSIQENPAPQIIAKYGQVEIHFNIQPGYALSRKCFQVSNADYTYDLSTNCLTLYNPIGKVDISAEAEDIVNYLCFTADSAGSTFKLFANSKYAPVVTAYYSRNKTDWISLPLNTYIELSEVGDKVYLKGFTEKYGMNDVSYNGFAMTGRIRASGDMTTLINGIGNVITLKSAAFMHIFENCTSLITPPELPSTNLGSYCYQYMFNGCTNLISFPELPATTLGSQCYYRMFQGCVSVVHTIRLPATYVPFQAYLEMFNSCTNMIEIPALKATSIAAHAYDGIFGSCEKIKMSETYSSEYCNEYTFGTIPAETQYYPLFWHTGGTFKDTPTKLTYYTSNTIIN